MSQIKVNGVRRERENGRSLKPITDKGGEEVTLLRLSSEAPGQMTLPVL